MARIRTIKPEFPQSESMGRVSRDARLLFLMTFTIVDDAGRARAASRMLASLLYPYDDDAKDLIDGWLGELECERCIRLYEVDGNTYLQIEKWLEHQKIDRPSRSRIPEPRSLDREDAPNTREPSATDLVPSILEGTMDLGPRNMPSAVADMPSPTFDEFWTAYPTDRNMSRKSAETQWKRLTCDKRTAAVAAVPGFKAYCAANGGWYRPVHAERFLSQERFEGYASERAGQADEAATRAEWGGEAGKLIDALGDNGVAQYGSWFRGVQFIPGNPPQMVFPSGPRRIQIQQRFEKQISEAYPGVLFEVRADAA
jgi:hypothetical protein